MKHLNEFIKKHGYELSDVLEYNSYRTGERSEIRTFDSISVTEILKLIVDPTFDMVKTLHGEALKSACSYGTKVHDALEAYHETGYLPEGDIYLHFKKALIQNNIIIMEAEQDYSMEIGLPFPLTAKIDTIVNIEGDVGPLDYKTTKNKRNLISNKHKLQLEFYKHLSNKDHSWNLYLNQKGYKLVKVGEYREVILDLIEYAKQLHSEGKAFDLFTKTFTGTN